MQIQLIRVSESTELIKNLHIFAKEAKIGVQRDEGKMMLKIEEYLFILHQLSADPKASEPDQMQWSFQFQQYAGTIASKYQYVYLTP